MKKVLLAAGVSALVALVLLSTLSNELVRWLWLRQLGFEQVFWRILGLQLLLFFTAAGSAGLYAWGNLEWAVRSTGGGARVPVQQGLEVQLDPAQLRWTARALSILIALYAAVAFAALWRELLLFIWHQPVGRDDPVFGRDLGFYLFRLGFWERLQNGAVWLTGVVFGAVLALYLITAGGGREAPPLERLGVGVRHTALTFLVFVGAWAWGYYLDRYQLLYSDRGVVFGAGYTAIHVLRYALWGMVAASGVLAGAVAVGLVRGRLRPPLLGLAGYAVLLVGLLGIWPGAVQKFWVEPNELEREAPYLERTIAHTRTAFGLEQVEEKAYPALADLSYADVEENRQTLRNVRLWDWRPLLQTYRQMQEIRLYYQFYEVDVDRYRLPDGYRQVMLSARELGETLPERADTWVNRALQFTHGYGLAMTLATQEGGAGTPRYLIRDLPPVAAPGLPVEQPGIYYGEAMPGYRVVNTSLEELDYPSGDENVYTHYAGRGGIPLQGFWRRLLFAWELGELNILLSTYIDQGSRIQLWRRIQERVSEAAPFLRLDRDPYLVLSDGRLVWIQDAYTTSDRYPYSEPYDGVNYIRNSVKAVVDAYHGTVELYVADPRDPVLAVYRAAFPELFRPLETMAEDLRAHLRYPLDLFRIQARKFATFHMTVPQVYYNREDLWTLPQEKYAGSAIGMEPYYILMRLPGEERLEFLLMLPFTPDNRDNMIAWLAARCDAPDYGRLLVYKLPKDRLTYGPLQVEALIDQDADISQQLSLWDQRGSQVIRGNLLVIPIERSFLYVEPVYLIAEGTDIPQLRRVIVAYDDRVAMEPTLEGALQAVFGRRPEGQVAAGAAPAQLGTAFESLRDAQQAYQEVLRALGRQSWQELGPALGALDRQLRDREPPASGGQDRAGDSTKSTTGPERKETP